MTKIPILPTEADEHATRGSIREPASNEYITLFAGPVPRLADLADLLRVILMKFGKQTWVMISDGDRNRDTANHYSTLLGLYYHLTKMRGVIEAADRVEGLEARCTKFEERNKHLERDTALLTEALNKANTDKENLHLAVTQMEADLERTKSNMRAGADQHDKLAKEFAESVTKSLAMINEERAKTARACAAENAAIMQRDDEIRERDAARLTVEQLQAEITGQMQQVNNHAERVGELEQELGIARAETEEQRTFNLLLQRQAVKQADEIIDLKHIAKAAQDSVEMMASAGKVEVQAHEKEVRQLEQHIEEVVSQRHEAMNEAIALSRERDSMAANARINDERLRAEIQRVTNELVSTTEMYQEAATVRDTAITALNDAGFEYVDGAWRKA